ncbi:Lysozyme [plant metagenome]|uniref:Lysozyme n=1 Tax=plant metagenome TaxID=1297885 RepID=A0A484QZB0_9ZZZZ
MRAEIESALASVTVGDRRRDDPAQDGSAIALAFHRALDATLERLARQQVEPMVQRLSGGMVQRTNQQNHAQTVEAVRRAMGVDIGAFVTNSPAIRTAIDAAALENTALNRESYQTVALYDKDDPHAIMSCLARVLTPEQCDALTRQEVVAALTMVDSSVPRPLPDGIRVALSSFVYNVGPGAYQGSTLLRLLRAGDLRGACNQLTRWVYAGGKKLRGLERRRAAEREICLSGL